MASGRCERGVCFAVVLVTTVALTAQALASTSEAHTRLMPPVPVVAIRTLSVRLPPWVLEQLRDFKRETGAPEGTNPIERPYVRPRASTDDDAIGRSSVRPTVWVSLQPELTADTSASPGSAPVPPAATIIAASPNDADAPASADAPALVPPPEPNSYRMTDFRSPVPLTVAGATVIDTSTAERIWRAGSAAFVDVLPRPPKPDLPVGTLWRTTPRNDIPGSVWLVNTGFGALSPEADTYFTAGLKRATANDRDGAVVFYCLSNCWMSWNAAKRAAASGYHHVLWYREGTDGWAAAGLPLERRNPEPGEPVRPPD